MKRHATAVWQGDLKTGKGGLTLQSGALADHPYSFKSRFEDEEGRSGANPEELIAAAHAGCFAMQLSAYLGQAGHPAERLEATATIEMVPGEGIKTSHLVLRAEVPGLAEAQFRELAEKAKSECMVSRALGAIEVTLEATLAG